MVKKLVPMGFRMINTMMDVWGFTAAVNSGLKQAREIASQLGEDNDAAKQ